ncbi:MAG: hypothetical protein DRJ50_14630, partial [Actinobacteria bacterium]
KDAFFPEAPATIHEPYILRDHRGLVIQTHPFQYNPVSGTLRVYSSITVELSAVGPDDVNVLDRGSLATRPSRGFSEIYDAHFVNTPPSTMYDPIDEEGDMLVICHDAWISNMQAFVDHKNGIGIDTTIVAVSTIGNNTTAIKNYIQGVYDSSNLAYVLLVGDAAEVATLNSGGGGSDPSYTKLAGGDHYPEIIIGRFSAQTAAHVDTQVQRTLEYEVDNATEQDWFWKGTGIGSAEGAGIGDEGQSDIVHQNEIRSWLLGAGYTEVDQIYDPSASITQVRNALNEGRGLVNYTGHGSNTSWSTTGFSSTNVNQLTNAGKLPVIISVACVNGNFTSGTCFAEAWLRATDGGEPSGAAATYMSTINQSWAPPMEGQDEFNILLTDSSEPYHSYGALCFAGSASMMDDYGSGGVSMFNTWHIFGDPSLRIVGSVIPMDVMKVSPETNIVAEGQAGGPFGPDRVDFTISNTGNQIIQYQVNTNATWLSFNQTTGDIWPGLDTTVTATFDEAMRNWDNGDHKATVQFLNLTNGSGDTSRDIELRIGMPVLQDEWSLDSNPGWTMEGLWAFGQPAGLGGDQYGYPDPSSGATGDKVFGVNLEGDYLPMPQVARFLTSPAMDAGSVGRLNLVYQRWLNHEGPPVAVATVQASVDGTSWDVIWANEEDVGDAAWTPQNHDLTTIAGTAENVYLRWGYAVNEIGAMPCSGWNLDDIALWGVPLTSQFSLTLNRDTLFWTPLAGASSYDVFVGDLLALRSSGGDYSSSVLGCVPPTVEDTTVGYSENPGEGEALWILVRGVSAAGSMTFESLGDSQVGLRDDEIAAGAGCP